jgi:hypothetical protein
MLSAGFREALEQRPAAPVEEIFALFMQASLAHVGAQTIAEDAGYADDTEGDSPAESVAKERMRAALDELGQVSDELEQAMATAEAAQELPEGVALNSGKICSEISRATWSPSPGNNQADVMNWTTPSSGPGVGPPSERRQQPTSRRSLRKAEMHTSVSTSSPGRGPVRRRAPRRS